MEKLTFCIGTSNNLNYLKLAIESVRKYSFYKTAPFIIFAENCVDGTDDWLEENKDKYNLEVYIEHNSEETRKGIGLSMNFCAEKVKTEYIMFLHADMVVSPDWDLAAMKHFEFGDNPDKKLWVSSYRIQPNVFHESNRPGTLIMDDFGDLYNNFDMMLFAQFAKAFSEMNSDIVIRKGEGVSGLIKKTDWDFIGGNDPIFTPLAYDDLDIFLRMQLKGFEFPLLAASVVYHFGSRSDNGHFQDENLLRSSKQAMYENRSRQRFIEKWGKLPEYDEVGFVSVKDMEITDKNNKYC